MPVTLYLHESGHPALRLCDPLAPCPPLGGYDPATLGWLIMQQAEDDESLGGDALLNGARGWDDGFDETDVPPPFVPDSGDYIIHWRRRRRMR